MAERMQNKSKPSDAGLAWPTEIHRYVDRTTNLF